MQSNLCRITSSEQTLGPECSSRNLWTAASACATTPASGAAPLSQVAASIGDLAASTAITQGERTLFFKVRGPA